MELEELRQNRFVRNFIKDKWLILGSTAVLSAFAALYVLTLYQPTYQSEAQVWIKNTSGSSYLSDTPDEAGGLKSLSMSGNPVMTEVQILKGNEIQEFMANYIIQHDPKYAHKSLDSVKAMTKSLVKIKTEPNTDVISVSLKWHDPKMAQAMLAATLDKFNDVNLNVNRQIYTKKRSYIDQQLADIQNKLVGVRQKIRQYQAGSMAVDVDSQTQELVRLRANLVAQLESVMAERNNNASNAAALQSQLHMSPSTAINAVALGSGNESLVKMRSDLAVLQQQLAHDGVRESATNPHIVALKNQINSLQSQINSEITATVGRGGGKGLRIYDNVRSQLVQDLASSRARSVGLGSSAASLSAGIARVDAALKAIPQNRFNLANLEEEEKALANAYDELSKRQIEASIKEAETPSNVFVVDPASMPGKQSFPKAWHLLALSAMLGLMAGFGLSALKTYSEDLAEGSDAVEEATRSKVLGVLPWTIRPVGASEGSNVLPINDVAYKHIVSNLRIEASKQEAEVITFTSSSLSKPQLSNSYNLAQRLARLGQSVVLIDADFRPSALHQFVADPDAQTDLTDLILSVDLKLRKGQEVFPEEVLAGLQIDTNGIYLALNRHDVDHAYDYFASRGFQYIVQVLKQQFDWVFIDTPSAVIAPEFAAISHISDGVVLFADRRATFSTLRKISRKIKETQVPLIGTIVRERNNRLEREHEEYTNWRNTWRNGGGGGGGGVAVAEPAATVAVANGNGRRVEFMGAKIDALTMQETVDKICEAIDNRFKLQHVVVNVAKLMNMRRDPQLREIVNTSGLVNADGAGVVLGAKLLGHNIPERVTGIDLMQELIETANNRGYRIFFLGAEEDVVRDVVTIYKRRYPSLQICGYRNGYFKEEDELAVAQQIRNARPDIVFVAMSSPKKEKFVRQYIEDMDVPFVMGVGGSFDVVAGKVKRAPEWMQASGLEWFYRFAQEPSRLWKRYLVTNAEFGLALVNAKLRPVTNG